MSLAIRNEGVWNPKLLDLIGNREHIRTTELPLKCLQVTNHDRHTEP